MCYNARQDKTIKYSTVRYNTITSVTQDNIQPSRQPSISKITTTKTKNTYSGIQLWNLAYHLPRVSMLLLLQPFNWTVMHFGLHYGTRSVSWGPQTAQYSYRPMRGFSLSPRNSWELRSSGLLRSAYSLRNNPKQHRSYLYCPLKLIFKQWQLQ
jgi:hypothetical protein